MKTVRFELLSVNLPFRKPFKHAAAHRAKSESIFLKCITDAGTEGWGECLPRVYVTGESLGGAFELLRDQILPRLIGLEFSALEEVWEFLRDCDGKAPMGWIGQSAPQTASWSAVDLALLDAFGRGFGQSIQFGIGGRPPPQQRYSAVISAGHGFNYVKSLAKVRVFGFRQVKLKVNNRDSLNAAILARRILGAQCDIRADANMAWSEQEASEAMRGLGSCGIRSVEQPLKADNIAGLARLVRDSGMEIIADESMSDRDSLAGLIAHRACTGVNIRISKCGGLAAAFARCQQATNAGLSVQIGCQVGESSLLSAANLVLVSAVPNARYTEGCFGAHLLREDPAQPHLQFGYGGRPPSLPKGPGLALRMDVSILSGYTVERVAVS